MSFSKAKRLFFKDSFTPSLHYYTVSRAEIYDEDHIGLLPGNYKIFLLNIEGYWNHGKTAGIAVDQTLSTGRNHGRMQRSLANKSWILIDSSQRRE